MEKSFDLSIIILTWNSKEFIERCIRSIYNGISSISFEVVIVDNGSIDSTKKILENYMNQYKNFRVIFLGKNFGTTKSRNIGIKEAKGEYILFLDSDAEVKKDTISKLLETFNQEKNVGAVAPKILGSNGEIQYSCKKFPTLPIKVLKFLGSLKIFRSLKNRVEQLELYNEKVYE
ncbi:MAG: glycosyltransferase, partial [archaeon]